MKVKFTFYYTYGKDSGDELHESYVIEDTRENRECAYNDFTGKRGTSYTSLDDFLNNKINIIPIYFDGGDWDDPTGGYITVTTYEEELERLRSQLTKLNREFEIRV